MLNEKKQTLLDKCPYKNMTIGQGVAYLKDYRLGSFNSDYFIEKYGKNSLQKLMTIMFAVEIIEEANLQDAADTPLVEQALELVDDNLMSQAETAQSYMKDWVAHSIIESDFSTLSFNSVMNIISANRCMRKFYDIAPSSAIPRIDPTTESRIEAVKKYVQVNKDSQFK